MTLVQDYVEFLGGLKADPSLVMVAGIFGDVGPVNVETDSWGPTLANLCPESERGIVTPSPRLTAFAEAFPARYQLESICDASQLAGPLARIAHTAGTVMSAKPCLLGPSPRLDTCRVFDVQAPRTAAETRTQVRACGVAGDVDCYVIEADAQCSGSESGLAVHVSRGAAAPAGTHVVVECLR